MDEGAGERDTDMGTLLMLGFSTQHPTVSCGTERPHLPPLGPAGVTKSSPGMAIVTKPRFRPSVSTAKSRYFNNLRLPYQTHTRPKAESVSTSSPERLQTFRILSDADCRQHRGDSEVRGRIDHLIVHRWGCSSS